MSALGAIASAVGAVAPIVGQTYLNRQNAKIAAQEQYNYQKKLMALQNEQNMMNWNAQAAYNSVGAQLVRMKAAGLSPTLIYGSGADGGIASAAPEVDTAPVDYNIQDPNLSGGINAGMSIYRAASEVKNIEAQTKLTQAKTLTEMWEAAIKSKDYNYADQIKNASLRLLGAQADELGTRSQVNEANVKKINEDTEYRKLVNWYYPELSDQSLAESRSRVSLNGAQIREINSKIRVNSKLVEKMDVEISKMYSEMELIASQKDLTDAQFLESRKRCQVMDSEIRKMASEIDLNEKELEYYIWNHPRTSSALGFRWNNSSSSGFNRDKISPTVSKAELIQMVSEMFGPEAAAHLNLD